MGWIALAVIGGIAFATLLWIGAPRALRPFMVAALLLGAAGYALQQHAGLPGRPVKAAAQGIEIEPGLVQFRTAILRGSAETVSVLAAADDRLRRGDTGAAARVLLRAIDENPGDPALWTGLGGALAAHDKGQMSPAARFAFARAVRLAPREPGPPFFLGLAFIQSGDLGSAKTAWLRALALAPRDAPYRVEIAERLVLIDQFQAMMAGNPPTQP